MPVLSEQTVDFDQAGYRIRVATSEDSDNILKAVEQFFSETKFPRLGAKLNLNFCREIVARIIFGTDEGIIFLAEDKEGKLLGLVMCSVYVRHAMFQSKVSTEPMWWVDKDYRKTKLGVELHSRYERWAKDVGCKFIQAGALDDSTSNLLKSLGYEEQDRTYLKAI